MRRGLAIRAWANQISEARAKLGLRPRITDANRSVVPRIMFDSSGWSAGASPADIVGAIAKAVGLPPIPTRTFRTGGVHVWHRFRI